MRTSALIATANVLLVALMAINNLVPAHSSASQICGGLTLTILAAGAWALWNRIPHHARRVAARVTTPPARKAATRKPAARQPAATTKRGTKCTQKPVRAAATQST